MKPIRLVTALGFTAIASSAVAQPNILLIIADDMGLDASACYSVGQQQATMPVIEALCAEGMVFENAYAAPLCSPTRASILTGQYGFRTGIGAPVPRGEEDGLQEDVTSLFDVLEPTGYATNLIGKWHLGQGGNGLNHPAHLGVPAFFGPFQGGIRDYETWTAVSGGHEVPVEGYSTRVLTDRAIEWTGAQDDPWFLWLAYNAPHTPFHAPPADLLTGEVPEGNSRRNPLPLYNAALEAMDTEIGRLLETVPEDTVVIFVGDNGTPGQVARDLYPGRGAKGTIYEGGTHVPLIVAGPGVTASRSDGFVYVTDLYATISAQAGAELDPGPDAFDFGPMLAGGDSSRDYIFVDHFSDRQTRGNPVLGWAMRVGDFKLVQPEGGAPQLFNLLEDPFEQHDLLEDGITPVEADIVAMLETRHASIIEN